MCFVLRGLALIVYWDFQDYIIGNMDLDVMGTAEALEKSLSFSHHFCITAGHIFIYFYRIFIQYFPLNTMPKYICLCL